MSATLPPSNHATTAPGRSLGALGAVVIGRNEGARLETCLRSLLREVPATSIVYVDSASSDGSVALATSLGVIVHPVDPSRPMSAARSRNEGFERLLGVHPEIELVQFVDGDCEVLPGWLARGAAMLRGAEDLAAVCGRTVERHRDATIYNRLCDIEFDAPPGAAKATGGIFMIRASAFRAVGGMRVEVVAGEEPEMGLRLRAAGWRLERLGDRMVLHDSAMTRFRQWWRRSVRSGVAYAIGKHLHGRGPERFCVAEVRRIALWAGVLPLLSLAAAWWTYGLSVLAYLALLAAQSWRIARRARRRGFSASDARLYGAACMLAKFPQLVGIARFARDRRRGRAPAIVEYK